MATRMMRVCDVCDAPAVGEGIRFGWGNSFYETDLCEQHGQELVALMERAIRTARRMGAEVSSRPMPSASIPPARKRRVDTKDVRAWAKREGIDVNEKGRVPESLIAQFVSAGQSS